jgi:hypothetical protein
LQIVFREFEIEIPDKQFGAHSLRLQPWTGSALATMFPQAGSQILTGPGPPEDFHVMEVKNVSRDGLVCAIPAH